MNILQNSLVRQYATNFAQRGWHIFQAHSIGLNGLCTCGNPNCSAKGKHPVMSGWQNIATINQDTINQWWQDNPSPAFNVAIATGQISGISVIDIDVKNNGIQTWKDICLKHNIPQTYTVKSGSGGLHLYFKYCKEVPSKSNALGSGVDTKSDGGYVIAPPSLHPCGQNYTVLIDAPLADFPIELLNIKTTKAQKQSYTPVNNTQSISQDSNDTPAPEISLAKAQTLLNHIDNTDYNTWLNVGIILGRVFNRSNEAWNLYNAWSNKNYDGSCDKKRDSIMQNAFYKLSQEQSTSGRQLGAKSLLFWAQNGGYTDIKNTFDINLFAYLASSNAFIFLPNGDKWTEGGVNGVIPPVIIDGDKMKASKWLIKNKAAVTMISNGSYPCGLIDGYYSKEGQVYPLEGSRILNLFNKGEIKPFSLGENPKQYNSNNLTPYKEDITAINNTSAVPCLKNLGIDIQATNEDIENTLNQYLQNNPEGFNYDMYK